MWGKMMVGAGTAIGAGLGANAIASNRAVQDGHDAFAGAVGGAGIGIGGAMMANRMYKTMMDADTVANQGLLSKPAEWMQGKERMNSSRLGILSQKADEAAEAIKNGGKAGIDYTALTGGEKFEIGARKFANSMAHSRMTRWGIAGLAGAAIGAMVGVDHRDNY